MTPTHAKQIAAVALLSVAGVLLFEYLIGRFVHIDPASVQRRVDAFGSFAPAAYVIALAITVVVAPIPSLPLDIAGGLAFGLWRGTIYILIAAMVGAAADFYISRVFGRKLLERLVKPSTLSLIDSLASRLGGWGLFVMRIEPLFNYKWVSYAAGLTSMPFGLYAIATFTGTLLPAIAIAYVGDTLLTHPGRSAFVLSLLTLTVVVPIIAAAGLGAGVFVMRRWKRR